MTTTMNWIFILIIVLVVVARLVRRTSVGRPTYTSQRDKKTDRGRYTEYDDDSEEITALSIVTETAYKPHPLMNKEEAYVFYKIENWVQDRERGERVFAQVSMGTYLKTPSDNAHLLIRYKRPDYLIVNRIGMPICVVEYQGGGHFQGDARERDKIKRAALESAGIPLVEIFANEKDNDVLVRAKLDEAF